MKINELEKMLNISRANIRFYEKEGLLNPVRKDNGYREYDENEIAILKKIIVFRKLGISIPNIKDIFNGKLTLSEAVNNSMSSINNELTELAVSAKLCKDLKEQGVENSNFDADFYWNEINKMETSGEEFYNFAGIDVSAFEKRPSGTKRKKVLGVTIVVLLIFVVAVFVSYLNSNDYLLNKMDKLYLSNNYSEINETYSEFFNSKDYERFLKEDYGDSYEDYLFSYETKYLVSLLATTDTDNFVDNFIKFTKELDYIKTIYFVQLFYDTINIDTAQNNELHKSIVGLLNATEIKFEQLDLSNHYASMLCFLNYSIGNNSKSENLIQKLQLELDDEFEDFWDDECLKHCGSLLLNKNYDRFNIVFIKAYNNEFSSTKSIAIMINQLGCDNEQLQVLSKVLKDVSDIQEKDNRKEAFKLLSDLAIQSKVPSNEP